MGRESPKVSGPVGGNSRFAEIFGGDWFDHDCRPTLAVGFDPIFARGPEESGVFLLSKTL